MKLAQEMLEAKKALEKLGHEAIVPIDTAECVENPELQDSLDHCENFADIDLDLDHYSKISESDAILVLNYPKYEINGYVGGATLMEIGIARFLNKKIFLLFDVPSENDLRYALEIKLAKPIVIKGDLNKII